MKLISLLSLFACFSLSAQTNTNSISTNVWDGIIPLSSITPGLVNTNLTIEQICTPGFVSHTGARHVTQAQERSIFAVYLGRQPVNRSDYEIDHLISLELGGVNDSGNLWPQSYRTYLWNAHTKDKLEDYMAASLRHCLKTQGHTNAAILLHTYQQEISHNWTNAYIKYLGIPLK